MARATRNKGSEQPEPDPGQTDLALNLAFASTSDLVAELMKRSECGIVAYQLTDSMMESEPSESSANRTHGGRWTATSYTGSFPECVGLCEIMKHDLLKEW